MSDSEEEVYLSQVCSGPDCCSGVELEYDVEQDKFYCFRCRELFARAETEGFRVILTAESKEIISLIFAAFDKKKTGEWDPATFTQFAEACFSFEVHTDTADELTEFFHSEYDISLNGGVVTLENLEEMYGGFAYNGVGALNDHADALVEEGILNLGNLE